MKKIISMILCLALLMGLCVAASGAEYTEVTIAKALEIAGKLADGESTTEMYCVTGTVSDLYNTTYGNMHLLDDDGNDLTVYGMYDADGNRYDAMPNAPVEGDVITVYGVLKNYKGTLEIVNATLVSVDEGETEPADEVAEYVSSVTAGTAYKLGLYQGTLGKQLYFTGEEVADANDPEKKYLATSNSVDDAVNVYLESVNGGYLLYFMDGNTKTYIETFEFMKEGNSYYSARVHLTTDPENVYEYDSDLKTLAYHYSDDEFIFMGTYNSFDTISASTSYYITGDKAANVEVSQFLVHFYAVEGDDDTTTDDGKDDTTTDDGKDDTTTDDGKDDTTTDTGKDDTTTDTGKDDTTTDTGKDDTTNTDKEEDKKPESKPVTVITTVSKPSTGVAYKLGMNQETKGAKYYFTGSTTDKTWYLATSTSYDEGVDVYVEAVEGGYRIYFMDGNTKTYIDMYTYTKSNGYPGGSLELTTEPEAVYTWDSEYKTFIATIDGNEFYFGSYDSYTTMGASDVYYIADSFPVHLYTKTTSSSNAATGDSISVFVAMMTVAAIGAGILVSKKKEF